MSLCTKFGYDMLRVDEKQAYFLFGGFAVSLISCHGQTVWNLKKLFDTCVQLGLKTISGSFSFMKI